MPHLDTVLAVLGVIGVPIAIGIGMTMANPSHGEFRFARGCFIVAAILSLLSVLWLTREVPLGIGRLSLTGLLGAAIAVSLAVSLDWVNKRQNPDGTIGLADFSWTWDPLSSKEIEVLYEALRNMEKQQYQIACISETCSALGTNFDQLFSRLGWTAVNNYRVAESFVTGTSGLLLNRMDEKERTFKEIIEKNTNLSIGLRSFPEIHGGRPPKVDQLVIIIGGKIPPNPLPPNIQKEISELSDRLKDLSADIFAFDGDRQRELARLPPIQGNDLNAMQEHHARNVYFTNETKVLMQNRFGNRTLKAMLDLRKLSIGMTWSLAQSEGYAVRPWAAWFGAMGNFLAENKIVEARQSSADDKFWFEQIR
jgi:hypothetical protein